MLTVGWFSTGKGEGSLGLLRTVKDAIDRDELPAHIEFVFCNRELGEAEGSDMFLKQALNYGISIRTLSSQRFRREQGGGPFYLHRMEFDREAMKRLYTFETDICVLAGYMLIAGSEMCKRYTMLNLHPALPGGPAGTWQDVIWKLIEGRAIEGGAYIHLATENLDQGPVVTYCSFPLEGNDFDPLWSAIDGRTVTDLKNTEGEDLPLFRLIRQYGVRRERHLLLETLKSFASGDLRVTNRQVFDAQGNPTGGHCLNENIEKLL